MYPVIRSDGVASSWGREGGTTSGPSATVSPSPDAAFAAQKTLTTLQVAIAEPLRIAPPVPSPARAPPMNAALAMPLEDAQFEHRVIENARSNWTSVTLPPAEDFRAALVDQHASAGLSREAVLAGIVVVGPMAAGDSERVAAAARSFESLCSMGFPRDAVLGALCKHAGDVSAATEACLGCAEGE